jgi:hypothetical protein
MGSDAARNTIVDNTVKDNHPFDLVYDKLGTGNRFRHNEGNTSNPPGLCPRDRGTEPGARRSAADGTTSTGADSDSSTGPDRSGPVLAASYRALNSGRATLISNKSNCSRDSGSRGRNPPDSQRTCGATRVSLWTCWWYSSTSQVRKRASSWLTVRTGVAGVPAPAGV